MLDDPAIRVITAAIGDGRVGFNQVVMEQDPEPDSVILAGWDQDTGVYVWECAHDIVARHSTVQHRGYSRCVPTFSVSSPPAWLGPPTFIPKEDFAAWPDVDGLATNTKRAAIIAALKTVLPL